MERLYIVRHGIAVAPGTAGVADDERPLTSKGQRRARQVAQGLRRIGVSPERIVTSPLPRARGTAEILAKALRLTSKLEEADALRAGMPADSVRAWLSERREERLMIVGHNPTLSDLVGLLILNQPVGAICELRKGGVAALVRSPTGGFHLDWLATPRMIRRYD